MRNSRQQGDGWSSAEALEAAASWDVHEEGFDQGHVVHRRVRVTDSGVGFALCKGQDSQCRAAQIRRRVLRASMQRRTCMRRRLLLDLNEQSGVVLVSDIMFVVIPRFDPASDSSTCWICLHDRWQAPQASSQVSVKLTHGTSAKRHYRAYIFRMLAVSHAAFGLELGCRLHH